MYKLFKNKLQESMALSILILLDKLLKITILMECYLKEEQWFSATLSQHILIQIIILTHRALNLKDGLTKNKPVLIHHY